MGLTWNVASRSRVLSLILSLVVTLTMYTQMLLVTVRLAAMQQQGTAVYLSTRAVYRPPNLQAPHQLDSTERPVSVHQTSFKTIL